ncbi:hypothetical protein J6590_091913 [Homalodisca vitripennis]|nr:hypothetical protein J6590_091913 [Homalodisca vitripennis]
MPARTGSLSGEPSKQQITDCGTAMRELSDLRGEEGVYIWSDTTRALDLQFLSVREKTRGNETKRKPKNEMGRSDKSRSEEYGKKSWNKLKAWIHTVGSAGVIRVATELTDELHSTELYHITGAVRVTDVLPTFCQYNPLSRTDSQYFKFIVPSVIAASGLTGTSSSLSPGGPCMSRFTGRPLNDDN